MSVSEAHRHFFIKGNRREALMPLHAPDPKVTEFSTNDNTGHSVRVDV